MSLGLNSVLCPVCGKEFIPSPGHLYREDKQTKHNPKRVCSYTCARVSQKQRIKEEAKLKRMKEA